LKLARRGHEYRECEKVKKVKNAILQEILHEGGSRLISKKKKPKRGQHQVSISFLQEPKTGGEHSLKSGARGIIEMGKKGNPRIRECAYEYGVTEQKSRVRKFLGNEEWRGT